ncbi:hypothetical protein [Anabaena sp. CCY 9402-a]|uniref:hypothetical protein n=1 Tax=Anabaena sp. CCY 9402-a TaxID=3103867 RepID=UPI0039C623E8
MNTPPQIEIGDAIEQLLSREEVAQLLGTNKRRLFDYLDTASLFIPRFKRFRSTNGGVSRKAMLSNWDVEPLKKIQHIYKKFGDPGKARTYIAEHPQEFN